jgi:hypothetical protein
MSLTNPVLGMAVYSLSNALELYQKSEERHRFGAIILMDLAVEYTLKAKLYQLDSADFIDNRQEIGFADLMKDSRISPLVLDDEKSYLNRVHTVRNYAQHRVQIPDSLTTQEYMKWLCKFIRRFSLENFGYDVNLSLPTNLRIVWTRLTRDVQKLFLGMPLKEPLDENYKSVRNWLSNVEAKSRRGYISRDYKYELLYHIRKYCNYLGMNPDELIDYANEGYVSPDEDLSRYEKTLNVPTSAHINIKNFYTFHKIPIAVSFPKYKSRNVAKEITTEQIRKLCDIAPLKTRSWILANSYMGLKLGKLSLLKVNDFRVENWDKTKDIYVVKIRKEVSNTYDYTTFIGADAKDVLKKYFEEQHLSSQDHPWTYWQRSRYSDDLKRLCQKAGFYEKGKTVGKSFDIRLKRILIDSGMPYDWVCYLFGVKAERIDIVRPLDEELRIAYEKAYPNLKVYEETRNYFTL